MFDINSYVDKVKKVFSEKKARCERLNPKTLLRGLYKEATTSARKLGGGYKSDVPDRYCVQINYQDWDDYFGHRRREIESYLATELHVKLSARQLASASKPIIELAKDYSLKQGEFRVKSGFVDNPLPEYVEGASLFEGANKPDAVKTIPRREKASVSEETPSFTEMIGSAKTKVMKDDKKVAYLVTKMGSKIAVHAGDTIGVVRNSSERRPDVVLDVGKNGFVSQIHGTFSNSDGWRFLDSSRNGTEVKLGAAKVQLREDEWTELEDGCEISFGHGEAFTFRAQ